MIYEKQVECLTPEQIISLQAKKLRIMINGTFNEIPQYRELIANALGNRTVDDINDAELLDIINGIAATDKELYHSIDTTILKRLDRKLFYIDSTSGSTGTPKSRYCSLEDDLHDTALISRAFSSYGVSAKDRVLLYDLGDMTFYTQFTKAMQDLGVKNSFYYSARHDFASSMEEALRFEPTAIITLPSILLRSFSSFENVLTQNCTIEKLIFFGEALDISIREYLIDRFNIECFSLYGSTDVGWIGAECSAHDGIHLFNDSLLVNFEDKKNSSTNPFIQKGDYVIEGEISFTSLFQVGKPNLRYKNGDRAIMMTGKCSCGRTTPRLVVLGRSAETFTILGMKVSALEIKELVFDNNDMSGFIQIELTEDLECTLMTLKLPKNLSIEKDTLIDKLENRCGLNFYNQMHVLNIDIQFVEESYFKNRKIPLVVDKRIKSI